MHFLGLVPTVALLLRFVSAQVQVDFKALPLSSSSDTFPDYSYSGAFYSSIPLPGNERLATINLQATNDNSDRTLDIQQAVESLPSGGVIQLSSGVFYLYGSTIQLYTQNVTIRGASPEGETTTLVVSGSPRYVFTFGEPKARISVNNEAQSGILGQLCSSGSEFSHPC